MTVLVEEFETTWTPESGDYSRKLVEFCCSRALIDMCCNIQEQISDGSFTRLSFDIMLAWENPSSTDQKEASFSVGYSNANTYVYLVHHKFVSHEN